MGKPLRFKGRRYIAFKQEMEAEGQMYLASEDFPSLVREVNTEVKKSGATFHVYRLVNTVRRKPQASWEEM
jgi:hypothetical protein